MAEEKETKKVPLTGSLERSARGFRDARKRARYENLQRLAGRPLPGGDMKAKADYNRSLVDLLKEIGMVEGREYADEASKRSARVTATTAFINGVVQMINTEKRTASADKIAQLRAYESYFRNIITALNASGGIAAIARGGRIDGEAEQKLLEDVLGKKLRGSTGEPELWNKIAARIPDKSQRDEFIRKLGNAEMVDIDVDQWITQVDAFRTSYNKSATDMGFGLVPELQGLEAEDLAAYDVNVEDPTAVAGFRTGLSMAFDPEAPLAQYLANPKHIDAFNPSFPSNMSNIMADLARAVSGGSMDLGSGRVEELIDRLVGDVTASPEDRSEIDPNAGYRQQIMQAMERPDAPVSVREAQKALMADPNYQAFKQAMGFETEQATIKSLMQMLRHTDKQRRKRDRVRMHSFRKGGYEDPKTQKVFESLQSQRAEASKTGAPGAGMILGATSTEDVTSTGEKTDSE